MVSAGCTADEAPKQEPNTSKVETKPAPELTEEPEPTETGPAKPERPAEMEKDDVNGAAASAEYFLELYPYVMATGDTAEWESMSYDGCKSCAGLIDQAEKIKKNGDIYAGGEVAVVVPAPGKYVRDDDTGIFPLDIEYSQEPMSISDASGEEVFSSSGGKSGRRVEMGRQGGEWIVVGITDLTGEKS
nr:DUF6318 family protein [Cellulosimicrobium arenosum]